MDPLEKMALCLEILERVDNVPLSQRTRIEAKKYAEAELNLTLGIVNEVDTT